jgi:proteasome lid subunit RPN8/RPN11
MSSRRVLVSAAALEAMRAHAEKGYPFEICGFLVGSAGAEGRTVTEAWPVQNAWDDDPEARAQMLAGVQAASGAAGVQAWDAAAQERRYLVSPRDIAACMRRAREAKVDLVGVYHTHPEHPAEPSTFDREAAWPEWSYVILSVRAGKVAEVRSWTIEGEDGPFVEEALSGETQPK